MKNHPQPTVVLATFQFISSDCRRDVQRAARRSLVQRDADRSIVAASQTIADEFNFTAEFRAKRKVDVLGSVIVESDLFGRIRSDHLLIENDHHGTLGLLSYIGFEDFHYDVGAASEEDHRRLVEFLFERRWLTSNLLNRPHSNDPMGLEPLLDAIASAKADSWATQHRKMVVGLLHQSADLIHDWSTVSRRLYGLLHMHQHGVSESVAASDLAEAQMQSTSFFTNFYQPDAILSLSTTFPNDAAAQDSYGTPMRSTDEQEVLSQLEARLSSPEFSYEPYDLLPDYPFVRSLAVGLIEYSANAEHVQRDVGRQLSKLADRNILRAATSGLRLRRLERVYFRARTSDAVRLPVVREFAQRLSEGRQHDENTELIDSLRASVLNDLVLLLTIVGIGLGVTQFLYEVLNR